MGPLKGVRIVEFDAIGPVPLCATLLADMGADIVRIARAGGQAAYEDVGEAILHRSRTAIELNLKSEADRETALSLIAKADILIEGFRPGVMERLGLGPEACFERAPALIYGRMTGWGQHGTLARRAGHDINYIAISGALGAMGESGRLPMPPLNLVGDYGGGAMFLAVGILAGLVEARASGKGQVVDTAMTDGVPLLLSLFHALRQNGGWREERESNLLDGGAPFYRCYECADGKYVAVGALEPQFFHQLLIGLDLDPSGFNQNGREGWQAMQSVFAERFRERSRDEWASHFLDTDACVSPVLMLAESVGHPHNLSRDTYVKHAGMVHPAPAPRFSRTASAIGDATISTAPDILKRWQ
jgi:alpha-methylacyl-CoA racemase